MKDTITALGGRVKNGLATLAHADVLIFSIIALVGVAGFGLGRLSALEGSKTPVEILSSQGGAVVASVEEFGAGSDEAVVTQASTGLLVGSKNSNKYHLPWCPGAQRISEANKVWFSSKAEAVKAGYEPASNCKGL
mgnify:CR=1 FL=1